jgi:Pilus formation protein N terminal region
MQSRILAGDLRDSTTGLQSLVIVSQSFRPRGQVAVSSSCRWKYVMTKERAQRGWLRRAACQILSTIYLAVVLSTSSECAADQLAPLTVEQPHKQTIVLTQGLSTTVRSERPLGKISIASPEIVDLVLRTDKSAVLIPERIGKTNIDFLDEQGGVIGSVDVIVVKQKITDRVRVYDNPSLGAYSSYHCGPIGCEYFQEMPTKEQALEPAWKTPPPNQ